MLPPSINNRNITSGRCPRSPAARAVTNNNGTEFFASRIGHMDLYDDARIPSLTHPVFIPRSLFSVDNTTVAPCSSASSSVSSSGVSDLLNDALSILKNARKNEGDPRPSSRQQRAQ
eukprot:jgi/Psemu1/311727/fgenesh1_kg.820_\